MVLSCVAAAIGGAEALVAYGINQPALGKADDWLRAPAEVVVLARDKRDLGNLPAQPGWNLLDPELRVPWTDDYADVLGAILDRKMGR